MLRRFRKSRSWRQRQNLHQPPSLFRLRRRHLPLSPPCNRLLHLRRSQPQNQRRPPWQSLHLNLSLSRPPHQPLNPLLLHHLLRQPPLFLWKSQPRLLRRSPLLQLTAAS